VDVITLTEYTNQVPSFYLQNSRRYKQITNFDCQIYKKQVGQEKGENLFALNSIKDRNFTKILLQMNLHFSSALIQKNSREYL
jgi:hypothetical protein